MIFWISILAVPVVVYSIPAWVGTRLIVQQWDIWAWIIFALPLINMLISWGTAWYLFGVKTSGWGHMCIVFLFAGASPLLTLITFKIGVVRAVDSIAGIILLGFIACILSVFGLVFVKA